MWRGLAPGLLAQCRQTPPGRLWQGPGSPARLRSPSPALPPPPGPRVGTRAPWVHGCPSPARAVLAVPSGERRPAALSTALPSPGRGGSPARATHCPPCPPADGGSGTGVPGHRGAWVAGSLGTLDMGLPGGADGARPLVLPGVTGVLEVPGVPVTVGVLRLPGVPEVCIGCRGVPGVPVTLGVLRLPGVPGGSGGSRRAPSGAGVSRGSRRSRPLAGPRCAGGGASGAAVPHPSSPVPCSQWEGGGRAGSAPRGFKAAPRARRRQRGERPPGRRLPPPCTDRPGPAPARPAPVSPASSGAAALALPSPRGRGLVGRRPTGGRGLCWAPGGSGRGGGGASGARWASAGPRGTQGRLLAPADRVSARPRLQAGHPRPAPRSRPRLGVGCALLPPRPWLSQGVPGHPPPGLVTRPRPGWGDSTAAGRDKGAGWALGALSLPILPWDAPGSGPGTSAWCCSRHGEGERCGWVAVTHPASGRDPGPTRDRHGPGLDPGLDPMIALSQQTWQQGSSFGVRQRWELLAAMSTTTLLSRGLGRGGVWLPWPCLSSGGRRPGLLTHCGPERGPWAVLVRVSPVAGAEGWVPAGPPASLAASRLGCPTASPAASSLRASLSPGLCWGDAGPCHPLWV